ncbi:TetR family transcriptional regulator [Erythrobacter sp. QSSC1-22B]|uniref:TetR/AcrR family transcriptional regulator n=1 Tax=Erythrobacter sp. QSSC1-22B TaxID=1860125 RepID=UPI000805EA3A|nr:TetR/AcrR family transcriptional regulator [Erythrobacter sp. QSSC1-22B]OBX19786.1 TetR family transcriptional regulator [Erythrobacter sp. QSSC1-22B]
MKPIASDTDKIPADATAAKPVASSAKSVRKRLQIVRAATEIINRKGYALATMTEIAAKLGLRDATLYYYYSSKQSLAYACHLASLQRIERLLDEAETSDGSGLQQLRLYIHSLLEDGAKNGSQLYVGDYSYLEDSERDEIATRASKLESRIEQILQSGVCDGSIVPCDARLVSQLIIGMLIWLARWTWSVENITVDGLMQAIGVASLDGLEKK